MNFEELRLKYKPDKILFLLVGEAPPCMSSERFFYKEDVKNHDYLFLETMKVLYPKEFQNNNTATIRKRKKEFLLKFKNDGYYLLDSLEEPFEERTNLKKKINRLRENQEQLLNKIKRMCNEETKIILISRSVYNSNYEHLIKLGVNIINDDFIDFPCLGRQIKYRDKMIRILNK